jgi:hypothetical protein
MKPLIYYMLRQEKHRIKWKLKRQPDKNKIIVMISTVKERRKVKTVLEDYERGNDNDRYIQ